MLRGLMEGAMSDYTQRIRQLLEIVHSEYRAPGLSIESVARRLATSSSHLSHQIRSELNSTFQRLLNEKRLLEAARMLSESHYSVKEIAAIVGYEHTQRLDRHFNRTFGLTPTQYRLRSNGGEPRVTEGGGHRPFARHTYGELWDPTTNAGP
jgi:AraC-like DNA-binding protein